MRSAHMTLWPGLDFRIIDIDDRLLIQCSASALTGKRAFDN
jgi:hypothetical protein